MIFHFKIALLICTKLLFLKHKTLAQVDKNQVVWKQTKQYVALWLLRSKD